MTLFWKNDQIIFTNIISILIAYYSQNAHVSTQKLRLDGCRYIIRMKKQLEAISPDYDWLQMTITFLFTFEISLLIEFISSDFQQMATYFLL